MKELTNNQRPSRAKNVALWALQILTAVAFLIAGIATLSGYPMMVETFEKIGVGQWFRYVAGVIEVASAILLLIPRLTPVGAALLVCTMVGAVLSHLFLIGGSTVPALVLLCFAAIILRGRFRTVKLGLRELSALARAQRGDAAISPERRAAMLNARVNRPTSSNA